MSGDGSAEVARLRMVFEGSRTDVDVLGAEEQPGKTNYLIGPESQWRTNIPLFGRVEYKGLYPGIDAAFYEGPGLLKYDFIVSPGADAASIRLVFQGARNVRVSPEGDLILVTEAGEVRQKKPVAYQDVAGQRKPVTVSYAMLDLRRVGFRVGLYDAQVPLVIDPLVYATYFGAEAYDQFNQAAFDAGGNIYVLGVTTSVTGVFSRPPTGIAHFVASLDPTGSRLRYLTYVEQGARGLAVDAAGYAYVGGAGPFVSKLAADGSGFVYSSVVGGSNVNIRRMAIDADGNAYVVGFTFVDGLHTTEGVFQPRPGGTGFDWEGFVAKFDPNGNLISSSYLGGNDGEIAEDVAVDRDHNVYVAGLTSSTASTFPPRQGPPTPQPDHTDGGQTEDAFIAKISADFSKLVYLTFVGGPAAAGTLNPADDEPRAIAVDGTGAVYVGGSTSSASLPPGRWPAYQPVHGPVGGGWDYDGFLVRVSADGTAYDFATFLGGAKNEGVEDVAVDRDGNAYATGGTGSPDFPKTGNADQGQLGGVADAFLARFSPDGQKVYASFVGGTKGDSGFAVAVREGPFTPGPGFQPGFGGGNLDGFLVGYDLGDPTPRTAFVAGRTAELPPPSPVGSITILPSTTRWKPQRSDDPISVVVGSSVDLDTGQPFILKYTGKNPDGTVVATTTEVPLAATPVTPPPQGYAYGYSLAWNHQDGTGAKLPAGNYTLLVKAPVLSNQSPVPPPLGSPEYDKVALVEVVSITIEDASGVALPNNPPTHGGGKRIFAEAAQPGGTVTDKLKVTATILPPVPDAPAGRGVTVHFKSFDVDDPTSSAAPVDDESWPTDNCLEASTGPPQNCPVADPGLLYDIATDPNAQSPAASGVLQIEATGSQATAGLRVAMLAGANYRVVASISSQWLGTLSAPGNRTDGAVLEGTTVLTEGQHATPMVTVWRTLHLQPVRMTLPSFPQSTLEHQATAACPTAPCIQGNLLEDTNGIPHLDHGIVVDTWMGADLDVTPSTPQGAPRSDKFVVTNSTATTLTALTPLTPHDPNFAYALWDDEVDSLSIWAQPDDSLARSILRGAYIEVDTVTGMAPIFKQNLTDAEVAALPTTTASAPEYWTAPVVLAYESDTGRDGDPSFPERFIFGLTNGAADARQPKVAIYSETIRDYRETPLASPPAPSNRVSRDEIMTNTTAHEILHLFGLIHNGSRAEGGIMCASLYVDANETNRTRVTANQLKQLRQGVELRILRDSRDCP